MDIFGSKIFKTYFSPYIWPYRDRFKISNFFEKNSNFWKIWSKCGKFCSLGQFFMSYFDLILSFKHNSPVRTPKVKAQIMYYTVNHSVCPLTSTIHKGIFVTLCSGWNFSAFDQPNDLKFGLIAKFCLTHRNYYWWKSK